MPLKGGKKKRKRSERKCEGRRIPKVKINK